MARITTNERYDSFGKAIKPPKVISPFSSKGYKMPDWWVKYGPDVQAHDRKYYYKGVRIIEIDNFDPPMIEPTTDLVSIQWSLSLEDGTYAVYGPQSWSIAKSLYESDLWWRNRR